MKKPWGTRFLYASIVVAGLGINACGVFSSPAIAADEEYERLKSQLGDKDQAQVARALSQAAALAKTCKLHIDEAQFQSSMRISGIEAQDLADGGKLHAATQEGVGSIDEGACHLAKDAFGVEGYEIRGLLK